MTPKTLLRLSLALLLSVGFAACANHEIDAETPSTSSTTPSPTAADSIYIAIQEETPTRTNVVLNNNKLSYRWQIGDTLRVYIEQEGNWYPIVHTLGKYDAIVDNRLERIFIPQPKGLRVERFYKVYGCVGRGAYLEKPVGSEAPKLVCQHGPWRRSLDDVAEDIVLTFAGQRRAPTPITGVHIWADVIMKHEGNVVAYDLYAGSPMRVKDIELSETSSKPWVLNADGTTTSTLSKLPTEENIIIDSDSRVNLCRWVRTQPVADQVTLSTTIHWINTAQPSGYHSQTLRRTATLASLGRGLYLRGRFETMGTLAYQLPKRSGTDAEWLKRWMGDFEDNTPLSDLLIPGAHEATAQANGITTALSRCQSVDIKGQLESGIRCIDVRGKTTDGKELYAYHGIVYQGGTVLDMALKPTIEFLKAHPTETVIMMLKDEGGKGDLTYQQVVEKIFAPYASYFYEWTGEYLRLGQMRGKIVLMTRNRIATDFGRTYALDLQGWGDNEANKQGALVFGNNSLLTFVNIQDHYSGSSKNTKDSNGQNILIKHKEFREMLDRSEAVYRYRDDYGSWANFNFNYLSRTGGTISTMAKESNAWAAQLIPTYPHRLRGVLMMDYAATTDQYEGGARLTRAILDNNYKFAQ